MAELMRVVCIGTVMLMLSGGAMGYYRDGGLEEAVEQIEAVPPDIDTAAYLLPKLSHNYIPYAPQSSNVLWKHVTDPSLYVLTETDSDAKSETKSKRSRNGFAGSGPSLSIVNPLDVLRQRLLLEIARRRMRQSENQIQANRELLKSIGKRSFNGFSSGHSHTFEQDRPEADHADRAKKPEQERDSIDGEQQIGRDLDRWNRHHAIHGENA